MVMLGIGKQGVWEQFAAANDSEGDLAHAKDLRFSKTGFSHVFPAKIAGWESGSGVIAQFSGF